MSLPTFVEQVYEYMYADSFAEWICHKIYQYEFVVQEMLKFIFHSRFLIMQVWNGKDTIAAQMP
jgi:hypothetical protein